MKATEVNFLNLMNSQYKQYIIPIYQRTYSWDEKRWQTLWDDIIKIADKPDKDRHFIGSVVCYKQGEIDLPGVMKEETVIDGQQRITTLSILLLAVVRMYNKIGNEEIASQIYKNYLVNSDAKDDRKFKLYPTNRDRETYKALIEDRENEVKDPSRNIIEAFKFFMEKLDEDSEIMLKVYKGIQKLDLVYIGLSSESDNPQLIFESMNSTGMLLTQGDLLRNYLLLDLPNDKQEDVYKKYWQPIEQDFDENSFKERFDFFLRDYLFMKQHQSAFRLDEGYEKLKEYYEEQHEKNDLSKENLLIDLRKYSKYYSRIYRCVDPDEELNNIWKELKIQRMDVANPFLMQVYNDYESVKENGEKYLSKEEFISIVKCVNSYVYRRYICGIPTNSLQKTFIVLCSKIDKDNYCESCIANILILEDYKEFPDDNKFKEEFAKNDIYTTRLRYYTLMKLENSYHPKSPLSLESNGDITIEHVLPEGRNLPECWREVLGEDWQNLQKEYVHTIGNLTLSNRAYNSEMQNYSFKDKLKVDGGIKYSGYRLSDDIVFKDVDTGEEKVARDSWTLDDINELSKQRAERALNIWPKPNLSEEVLEKYIEHKDKKDQISYVDLSHYPQMNDKISDLYERYDKSIMNLPDDIERVYNKFYVAYKIDGSNFVEIIIKKSHIKIRLHMPKGSGLPEIDGFENIEGLGRWGTGNFNRDVRNSDDFDLIMKKIGESLELVKNEE